MSFGEFVVDLLTSFTVFHEILSMPDGRRTLLLALAFFRAALGDGRRTFPAHLAALRAVFLIPARKFKRALADGAGLRLLRGHGASPPFAGQNERVRGGKNFSCVAPSIKIDAIFFFFAIVICINFCIYLR